MFLCTGLGEIYIDRLLCVQTHRDTHTDTSYDINIYVSLSAACVSASQPIEQTDTHTEREREKEIVPTNTNNMIYEGVAVGFVSI